MAKAAKKPVAKKPAAKVKAARAPAKKPAAKKPAAKKPAAKKTSASQSIAKKPAAKLSARGSAKQPPIEMYYWPTPTGWKISIMLEECGLPYNTHMVNIAEGDQFKPEFLAISPNNRIPAIVDPSGPGGKPVSVFESGAILQYLGRKTGKFYGTSERGRIDADQWLMWQMGGLGPMSGQNNHFRFYAPEQLPYAVQRYTGEVTRLYGVMDRQLAKHEFLAGKYSIADMACVGWVKPWERQGQKLDDFPNLKRWYEAVMARPAVQRGMNLKLESRGTYDPKDPKVQALLFGNKPK